MTTDAPATTAAPSGVGSLFQIPAFSGVMVANVLSAVAFGTSRFVFVWLVGELTDWNPATAILGIVIGLPPLTLSAWAGSLADRHDPRRLGVVLFAISAVLFGITAAIVAADAMTVPLAMLSAFITAITPSMLMPLLQALIPAIVPPTHLMQAVAIQNLGMMVSTIAGVFLGGAVSSYSAGRMRRRIIRGPNISAGWRLGLAFSGGIIRSRARKSPVSQTGPTISTIRPLSSTTI